MASLWAYSDLTAGIGAVTMVSAALGLGRMISLPISGPLSDKFGRKPAILIEIVVIRFF